MDRADTQSLSYLSKNKGHTWFYDASTSSSHQQHASTSGRGGQLLDFGRKQACNYVLGNSYKRINTNERKIYACTIYGKEYCCVPSTSRRELSTDVAEGSDFIPGHFQISSRRRDEYSCGSGPLGKDARLLQPCRSRTFSAEGSMMHNYLKLYY